MTKIIETNIARELRQSFISYATSVIIARALPDVRDGLKPVHRRILFSMHENGYEWNKPFRKSARIVGDVMGKYHPHGDSAIYDTMVRMAQGFSMSVPLIDGQGNFGSIDGDPAAAMRYTEARMTRPAGLLLDDLDKNTVDFRPNYDGSEQEPIVIPARFPNLLVNGSEGIAVGMSTGIAPHNMAEALRATIALVDNPDLAIEDLMNHISGPDFPTGGSIIGHAGIREAYLTGKGTVTLQAKHHIEEARRGRESIVFTEMPYQVNKARVVELIDQLVREKKLDGIAAVRDESDREGIRLVVEVKSDIDPHVVLARLHKMTPLRTTFSQNMLALRDGRPVQLNLKEILEAFISFRKEVVRRRTAFHLRKARARAHVVLGLLLALGLIDKVIATIRASKTQGEAQEALMKLSLSTDGLDELYRLIETRGGEGKVPAKAHLSEVQAKAILEMRLQRLVGLERDNLAREAAGLIAEIGGFVEILRNADRLSSVVRSELEEVLAANPLPRRTTIEEDMGDYDAEDLIPRSEQFVTISHQGYVKRQPLGSFRSQKRGGKGKTGTSLKDDDFVVRAFAASTHTPILFFTDKGQAYKLKVWQLPEAGPQGRGRPIVNLLNIGSDERIAAILTLPETREEFAGTEVAFVTRSGHVRRNSLEEFLNVPSNGKIAMKFDEGDDDALIAVFEAHGDQHILLTTRDGMALRFPADEIRLFSGRGSKGVRGIRLKDDDVVVSAMALERGCEHDEAQAFLKRIASERKQDAGTEDLENAGDIPNDRFEVLKHGEQMVLSVSETGFGKRTSAYAYRPAHRGGIGVQDKSRAKKVGLLIGSFLVPPVQDVMIITAGGQSIRIASGGVRITGRGASGVTLFKLPHGDRVAAVVPVDPCEDDEESED